MISRFRRLNCAALLAAAVLLAVPAFNAAPLGAAAGAAGGTSTSIRPAKEPPFYRGELPSGGAAARLPLRIGAAAGVPESWLPQTALARLAADLDGWLADAVTAPLLAVESGAARVAPPAVYLGCALDEAIDECSEMERSNVLAVTSGTKEWRRQLAAAAQTAGAGRVLVIQLQVAPHWIHQRGLKGKKEARLGTGYVQALPWLSSLDSPVWVLQLTGAVVDAEGAVQRSGGEGIWALRTPFRVSTLGAQRLISDEDVEFVRTELRRPDLPATPLAWEAALRQLVTQLLGPG